MPKKVEVVEEAADQPVNEDMQATLSILSLLLGAFTRAAPTAPAKALFAKYFNPMLAQFKKYKVAFPKAQFKPVHDAFMSGKTRNPDYFWALQAFTKEFAPQFRAKAENDPTLDGNVRLLLQYTFSMCNVRDLERHASAELLYQKNLRYLTDQKVRNLYPAKLEVPDDAYKQVEEVVRKVTGRKGDHFLSPEELKKLQAEQPAATLKSRQKLHQAYIELHKPIKVAYDQALKRIIPDSKPRPITEVKQKLLAMGVKAHRLDPQLEKLGLHVNDVNQLFTPEGRQLQGNIKPGMTIVPNENYDPKDNDGAPFKYYDPAKPMIPDPKNPGKMRPETYLYMYTGEHVTKREDDKAERAENDEAALPEARKSWLKDLRTEDVGENEYNYVLGLMTEIMHTYAQRIGNLGNRTIDKKTGEENETFGLTTLTAGNVKVGRAVGDNLPTIEVSYPGKDNVDQGFFVDPKKGKEQAEIVEGILWLLTDYDGKPKKPTEPLFTVGGKRITSNALGTYVKGKGISKPHSLRHLHAEKLARPIMAKAPKFDSPKEANKWLKENLKPVGEALGHIRTNKEGEQVSTAATALKSYISRATRQKFFTDRKLAIPDEHKT